MCGNPVSVTGGTTGNGKSDVNEHCKKHIGLVATGKREIPYQSKDCFVIANANMPQRGMTQVYMTIVEKQRTQINQCGQVKREIANALLFEK